MTKRAAVLTRVSVRSASDKAHLLTVIRVALEALEEGDEASAQMILRTALRQNPDKEPGNGRH